MKGYHNDQDLTDSVLDKNGWFYTGDLAKRNNDDAITFIGRKREIIKTPNEQIVYLNHVIEIVNEIAGIKDVAILTCYDNDVEKINLFMVYEGAGSKGKTSNLIKSKISDSIGDFSLPISIRFLLEISYSNSGKVVKESLKNALQ